MPKIHIVVGVARSGTSLASGLLDSLGVPMHGSANASSQNPRGSFEDPDFIDLTIKMHTAQQQRKASRVLRLAEKIPGMISRYDDLPRWGWKSALTHNLWRFFEPYLDPDDTFLLFVHRGLEENAQSMIEHRRVVYNHTISMKAARHIVQTSRYHLERMQWKTRKWPYQLHLTYQMMRLSPIAAIVAICETAQITPTEEQKMKAMELVIPDYHSWKPIP